MRFAQLIMERLRGQTVTQSVPHRPEHITRLSDNKVFYRTVGGLYQARGDQEFITLKRSQEIINGTHAEGYSIASVEAPDLHAKRPSKHGFILDGHAV